MSKSQRYYSREFKQEAVQLLQTSGATQAEVARNLGVAESSLWRWANELAEHGMQAFPGSGHQHPADEEVRRLKRELEQTRQERDIFKKAVAIFSHPSR